MEETKIKNIKEPKEVPEVIIEEPKEVPEVVEPELSLKEGGEETEEPVKEEKPWKKGRKPWKRERYEKKEEEWIPKTKLGKEVKVGKIKSLDDILKSGKKILEAGIVDTLLPNLQNDLILIGQAKGKFGGGKRRAWRQTQKKTAEENIPSFSCMVVIGDGNGHLGIGMGKARETLPAREKAMRNAKLNIIKIKRGCGSFDCGCREEHSIPFVVNAKCGSSKIRLIPAPKGTGLAVEDECKKVLKLAGIADIYSKTGGQTKTKFNLITALFRALEKTTKLVNDKQ